MLVEDLYSGNRRSAGKFKEKLDEAERSGTALGIRSSPHQVDKNKSKVLVRDADEGGMAVTLEQNEAQCVIRLEGEIGIASAAELKKLLLQALTSGGELRVDLERATEMDVTAWQLLWAVEREARGSGVGFALAGRVPEEISAAVREAGFDEFPVTVGPK
jgi:anti-anti-sigma factor